MPLDSDVFDAPSGYNAPQQVHITQGDRVGKAMIVSWVTMDEPGSNTVVYWTHAKRKRRAEGMRTKYSFFNYTSGFIHHCNITHLKHDTKYYYTVGVGHTTRTFSFMTPPEVGPDVPYTFGLIGDLGQSYDSNTTLTHYETNPGEDEPFIPFIHRYHVPYKSSQSTSPFWYSIKRASAHIIVLSSYSAYGKYTPQYKWLFMEGETMRVMFEPWFVKYKVDVVFAGHVHAYERSERVSNIAYNIVNGLSTPVKDQSAPVYITIGDGGNLEGLATK
uniref:acid phosphatase n=1 Tax=Tanacetum cinerariifolium TaxID=118510 RepID=A0A6L2NGM0_TANCI|nr:purple acid phosphatase [Tanacetum cinerariifolium]